MSFIEAFMLAMIIITGVIIPGFCILSYLDKKPGLKD